MLPDTEAFGSKTEIPPHPDQCTKVTQHPSESNLGRLLASVLRQDGGQLSGAVRRENQQRLPAAITSAADNQVGEIAAVVDALGKHLAIHKVARGRDFWQSGNCCLWPEGHGMPSDKDAISAIVVATGSATIIAAADGVTIGTVRRLKTAKTSADGAIGSGTSHRLNGIWCSARTSLECSRFRQVMRSIAQASAAGMTYVPVDSPGHGYFSTTS